MNTDLKLASWVIGEHLAWANSYLKQKTYFLNTLGPYKGNHLYSGDIGFFIHPKGNFIEKFLSFEESKARINTLCRLIESSSNQLSQTPSPLNLLYELRYCFDHFGAEIPASNIPQINKAVDNFKRATLNLFDTLGNLPSDSTTMIDGLLDIYIKLPLYETHLELDYQSRIEGLTGIDDSIDMALELRKDKPLHKAPDEHYQELINIIDSFAEKSPKQVLFDFADTLKTERLNQFDSMFQSKGGAPSADLLAIRKIIYKLADIVGINAIKDTRGILSLVAYLMKLNNPKGNKTSSEHVSNQVNTAIWLYEKHGY